MDQTRDVQVDAVRGVAIAALVLSHTLAIAQRAPYVSAPLWFIVTWNMPLFFFVSGWAMRLRPATGPLQTLTRRAKSLLVPYLSWTLVRWAAGYTVGSWFEILFAPEDMWFLYCLFMATVTFTTIVAVGRRTAVVVVGTIVVSFLVTLGSRTVPIGGFLTLENLGRLLPFLMLGYYACHFARRLPRLPALSKAWVSGLVFALSYYVVYQASGVTSSLRLLLDEMGEVGRVAQTGLLPSLANRIGHSAVAVAAIATVWHTVPLVPRRTLRLLASLGRASLGIYGLNSILLTALRLTRPDWSVTSSPALTLMLVTLAAAIVLLLSWGSTVIMGRFALSRGLLLGQWKR